MSNFKAKKNLIFVLSCLLLISMTFLLFHKKTPNIDDNKISTSSLIEYPSKYNYRQTTNDCAPFSTAAVVRALTKEDVDSLEFAKNISWRLPNKYTLPWGLENQLKDKNITVETPSLKHATDENKILFLKERLSQKEPIIILGEVNNYEHYLTLLGFDTPQDIFYVYDSLYEKSVDGMTKDGNDENPGNRNLTTEELLNFWRGGGMYGLYHWYAIVAKK